MPHSAEMSSPNKEELSKKILNVTREALEAGATIADVQRQLAPLVGRSVFFEQVKRWREQGLL